MTTAEAKKVLAEIRENIKNAHRPIQLLFRKALWQEKKQDWNKMLDNLEEMVEMVPSEDLEIFTNQDGYGSFSDCVLKRNISDEMIEKYSNYADVFPKLQQKNCFMHIWFKTLQMQEMTKYVGYSTKCRKPYTLEQVCYLSQLVDLWQNLRDDFSQVKLNRALQGEIIKNMKGATNES